MTKHVSLIHIDYMINEVKDDEFENTISICIRCNYDVVATPCTRVKSLFLAFFIRSLKRTNMKYA